MSTKNYKLPAVVRERRYASRRGRTHSREACEKILRSHTRPVKEVLCDDGSIPLSSAKGYFLKLMIRLDRYFCQICRVNEWDGKFLILQVDHIDGNNINHTIDNLRLLCPNCHSMTHNFGGGNSSRVKNKGIFRKELKKYHDSWKGVDVC